MVGIKIILFIYLERNLYLPFIFLIHPTENSIYLWY